MSEQSQYSLLLPPDSKRRKVEGEAPDASQAKGDRMKGGLDKAKANYVRRVTAHSKSPKRGTILIALRPTPPAPAIRETESRARMGMYAFLPQVPHDVLMHISAKTIIKRG